MLEYLRQITSQKPGEFSQVFAGDFCQKTICQSIITCALCITERDQYTFNESNEANIFVSKLLCGYKL